MEKDNGIEEQFEMVVPEEYHLERVDTCLTACLEIDVSRSRIQKLIKSSNVLVNGKKIKANYNVKTGDEIVITFPTPETLDIVAQDIPVEIVYEDESIAVINKQPGLVVHPGSGNWDHTLVNGLLFHMSGLSSNPAEMVRGLCRGFGGMKISDN